MIDACNKIGRPQHVATIQANELRKTLGEKIEKALTVQTAQDTAQAVQAEAQDQKVTEILTALHLNSQQQSNTMTVMPASVASGLCYLCKQLGHIMRNCPETKRHARAPDPGPRCKRGRHFIKRCLAKYDIDGNLIPKNLKMSTQSHHAMKQIAVPQILKNSPKVKFVNTLTPTHCATSPVESQVATQTYYPQGPGVLWQPPNQQAF